MQIKTEYKRIDLENYMCIHIEDVEEQEIEKHFFEFRILAENKVPSLLHVRYERENSGFCLYYKISSKQKLDRLLSQKNWTVEQVQSFLRSLLDAMQGIQEYMLDMSSLYIHPDYIFADTESIEPCLCYVPLFCGDVGKAFSDLLFRFIEHSRHSANQDWSSLYTCYHLSREENRGISDWEEALRTSSSRQELKAEKEKLPYLVNTEEIHRQNDEEEEKEDGFGFHLKSIFSKKKKKDSEAYREERKQEDAWEAFFSGKEKEVYSEAESAAKEYEHTVLLTEDTQRGKHRLRCIRGGCPDIILDYFPFVVGRQERLCDFCLDREGISRIHFRIEKMDEHYVVSDLNSRNGVWVEGRLLENEEYCVIKTGDKLQAADLEFVFE